jgi:VCBS repeat-containing protein
VDLGDGLTYSTASSAAYGSFSLNAATGAWSYSLNNGSDGVANSVQSLAAGQTATDAFTITVADQNGGSASQLVSILITGSNDAPTITAAPDQVAPEDGAIIQDQLQATDVDATDSVYFLQLGDAIAGLTINSDGGWSFDPGHAAYQYLSRGEIIEIPVFFAIHDRPFGTAAQASASSSFIIQLVGSNDAVALASSDAYGNVSATTGLINENQTTAAGAILFTDVDGFDGHSALVTSQPSQSLGSFTLGSLASPFAAIAGQVEWSYAADPAKLAALAPGQTVTETYAVTLGDPNGSTVTQAVTITLQGTNQAPVISTNNGLSTLTYSNLIPGNSLIYTVTDPDGQVVNPSFRLQQWSGGSWLDYGSFTQAGSSWMLQTTDWAGANTGTYFSRTSINAFTSQWSLEGYNYLAAGSYRYLASFADSEAAATVVAPVEFNVAAENLAANWAAEPLNELPASALSGTASGVVPLRVVLAETDLAAGALSQLAGAGAALDPLDLKVQIFDQLSGRLLASTHPASGATGVAQLSLSSSSAGGSDQLIATANLNDTLQAGEFARHYSLRTVVSGRYYNYLSSTENTLVSLYRGSGALAVATDALSPPSGYSISGLALNLASLSGSSSSGRLLSAELSGSLPQVNGYGVLANGNYSFTSSQISSVATGNIDADGDGVIDYRSVQIDGLGSLQAIAQNIDALTGEAASASSGSSAVPINSLRFRVRFYDYDLASAEPLSGIYSGQVESKKQNGAAGTAIDQADFVVYQPGSSTAVLFTTNGFDPIKSSLTSPLDAANPQSAYQPNVWI